MGAPEFFPWDDFEEFENEEILEPQGGWDE